MPFGTEVGLGPGLIALDGNSAPQKRGTAAPNFIFSADVCCGQTAGWIKIRVRTIVQKTDSAIVDSIGQNYRPMR